MRVIAGTARGTLLQAPRDRITRPITDRVKETLFDILGASVSEARVLDLYAGSGAIGVEALSRGASHATFVERGAPALNALRQNLQRTRLADRATVVAADVLTFLGRNVEREWDLAVLDPPYEERAILAPLERLASRIERGGTVVVKHFWRTPVPEPAGLAISRVRRFGETSLTFLRHSGPTSERAR
jgi:16S rRNA (guanine966-N2)-methyltransferase